VLARSSVARFDGRRLTYHKEEKDAITNNAYWRRDRHVSSTASRENIHSATDVAAMIARAKNERKPDQANFIKPLPQAAPYTVNLEYRVREVAGTAAVHETEAEMFYVIDGEATLITGGKLRDEKRTNPTNLSGTSIEGGSSRHVAKGDFFLVPENTPHGFTEITSTLVLMSVHVPRGGAAK
jgi:mannose-6-phosphate isomerase-like protein (cupin superfamily)